MMTILNFAHGAIAIGMAIGVLLVAMSRDEED